MYGSGGNFTTELDYLELGHRVAVTIDSEAFWGAEAMVWWAFHGPDECIDGDYDADRELGF